MEEKYEKKTVKRCEKRNYMKEKGLAIDVRRKVEVEENHCHWCRGRRKYVRRCKEMMKEQRVVLKRRWKKAESRGNSN